MRTHLRSFFNTAFNPALLRTRSITLGLAAAAPLLLASCATEPIVAPVDQTPVNTIYLDEFYTPMHFGSADDYFIMYDDDDDNAYTYFLDERDYIVYRNTEDDDDGHEGKHKIKRGHGYGDYNHLHKHWKIRNHRVDFIMVGVRRIDWTDSLALTRQQMIAVDSGMRLFHECANTSLDSFRVLLKPAREEFRLAKMGILAQIDTAGLSRDSARTLLDSAIERYETKTELLRNAMKEELKSCLTELDAYMQTKLTPAQYEIWIRHRGW